MNDDIVIAISKIGGPLILFILSPCVGWIMLSLYLHAPANDPPTLGDIMSTLGIFILIFGTGVYACRIGYGWFNWKRRNGRNL